MRGVRGFSQGLAQTLDGCVQAPREVDKGVRRPQPLPQRLPGYHIARVLQEGDEYPKRLVLEPDLDAVLAEFRGSNVEIGREPDARNAMAVAALYRRIGHEASDRGFETLAAQETGSAVCAELGSSIPPTPARTTGR